MIGNFLHHSEGLRHVSAVLDNLQVVLVLEWLLKAARAGTHQLDGPQKSKLLDGPSYPEDRWSDHQPVNCIIS